MEYRRITQLQDPLFKQMHGLMEEVFPPEEVLAFQLWEEPLQDPDIRVFVAVHEGVVVGATEYRYYADLCVAMTDFTIIGREGLGVGPFLLRQRQQDLEMLYQADEPALGMFAEIYNPYLIRDFQFGGIKPMDPYVRREVLAHIGYRKLNFPYVHPSWHNDGNAVEELDLCFLAYDQAMSDISADLVASFLRRYYAVLENKPQAWSDMVEKLETLDRIELLPI